MESWARNFHNWWILVNAPSYVVGNPRFIKHRERHFFDFLSVGFSIVEINNQHLLWRFLWPMRDWLSICGIHVEELAWDCEERTRYLLVHQTDDDKPVVWVEAYDPYMIQHELKGQIDLAHYQEWLVGECAPDDSVTFLGLLSDFRGNKDVN